MPVSDRVVYKMRHIASLFSRIRSRPIYWPRLLLIASLEIVLAFSSFGYIVMPPVSMAFVSLPVLIGAFFLGPLEGMLLGALFGLTSVWKASLTATLYADIIFSPLRSGQASDSVMLAIGARMAFGLLAGHLYVWAQRRKRWLRCAAITVSTITALFVHSLLVHSIISLCFPKAGFSPWQAVETLFSLEGFLNWAAFALILLLMDYAMQRDSIQRLVDIVSKADNRQQFWHNIRFNACCLVIISGIALSLFYHFLQRTKALLAYYQIFLSDEVIEVIMGIGLQFLAAVFALSLMLVVVLMYFGCYSREIIKMAERDALTGLYNRGASYAYICKRLEKKKPHQYMMLIDVDNFKRINDLYGHPAGDRVLQAVALVLKQHFPRPSIVGRFGGDEFVVCTENLDLFADDSKHLEHLLRSFNQIQVGSSFISCSVGVAPLEANLSYEELYRNTDSALYEAKNRHKNCFAVYEKDLYEEATASR